MRVSFLLPLVFLGLAGCVSVDRREPPTSATVVTPAPAPTTTYVAPAPPTSTTTVVRTP